MAWHRILLCGIPASKAVLPEMRRVKKKRWWRKKEAKPNFLFPTFLSLSLSRGLVNYLPRTVEASDLRRGLLVLDIKHIQL